MDIVESQWPEVGKEKEQFDTFVIVKYISHKKDFKKTACKGGTQHSPT